MEKTCKTATQPKLDALVITASSLLSLKMTLKPVKMLSIHQYISSFPAEDKNYLS